MASKKTTGQVLEVLSVATGKRIDEFDAMISGLRYFPTAEGVAELLYIKHRLAYEQSRVDRILDLTSRCEAEEIKRRLNKKK